MALLTAFSEQIWRTRYRAAGETDLGDTWRRVATAVASTEAEPTVWRPRFEKLLSGLRFLPGGRILAGAGTRRG